LTQKSALNNKALSKDFSKKSNNNAARDKSKKSSYASRMSKANVRAAKTIKSKQSKSIFTQREEE
jgi:hypothetical protein